MTETKKAPTAATVKGQKSEVELSYHDTARLSTEAAEITRLHALAQQHAKAAIDTAIEIGGRLAAVKKSLPHGGWMGWVKKYLPFGVNEAANYMRVNRRKAELNSQPVVNLKQAVEFLAEPKPPKLMIDPEFSSILPPLRDCEKRQLEENLIADGCRCPLVVWRGILLDGHARYAICQKHGIAFKTVEEDLPDREAAIDWIIANQLGRSNLTAEKVDHLRGTAGEIRNIHTQLIKIHGSEKALSDFLDSVLESIDSKQAVEDKGATV